jgi:2-C-methyl-D-erythritol 4-phosphate cytidylyltransferase
VHAARAALESGVVDLLTVAAPGDLLAEVESEVESEVHLLGGRLLIVSGGASRRESVAAALTTLPVDVDVVLVHDAARCLAPPPLFASVAAAVAGGADAVVPVLAVADTVKEVSGDLVLRTLDRSALRAAQTPQGFRRDVLVRAHAAVGEEVTDDAGLVERDGGTVRVVAGHEDAFKVTRPLDMLLAEAVVARRTNGVA